MKLVASDIREILKVAVFVAQPISNCSPWYDPTHQDAKQEGVTFSNLRIPKSAFEEEESRNH
jgi:hypothetical protein